MEIWLYPKVGQLLFR